MINTTSKRKRKSHNNRTRLSRRVKRGGVPVERIFSMLSSLLTSHDPKQESEEKKAVTDKSKPEETETKPETKSKDKTEEALDNMLITDEATYLQVLNNTRALYNLTYETINKRVITEEITKKLTTEEQASNVLDRVLKKMRDYNTTRLTTYEELFKTTIPVYPYARIQTKEDKTHPNYITKLNKIQALKDKKTYTNNDYYIRGWGEGG